MAIEDVISGVLKRADLKNSEPEQIERDLVQAIRTEYGGSHIYVGTRGKVDIKAVRDAFDGHNIDQLIDKFGLSRSRLYQILNEVEK